MSAAMLLSLMLFLPALGGLVLLVLPWVFSKERADATKLFSLAVTMATFLLSLGLLTMSPDAGGFQKGVAGLQDTFNVAWIPSFNIFYFLGLDGISFPLVVLTTFLFAISMWASFGIERQVRAYCILFLILETGVLGVFLSLDFFLFYVFWEVMLLPMYFLIGIWGGPRREYAAIKFFLYTLAGGVLMLIAIIMLYFYSDLGAFNRPSAKDPEGRPLPGMIAARGQESLKWREVGLAPETLALVRVAGTTEGSGGPDARITLAAVNVGTALDGARLVFSAAGAEAEQPGVAYDAASRVLTVALPKGATAAQVVRAINADAAVNGQFEASLASGCQGNGEVAATDRATLALPSQTVPLHTFNIAALAKLGQFTDLFDQVVLGVRVQCWAFWLLLIGFLIKVPSVPLHTWLPDAHVEAPTPISMILAGILLKLGGYGIIRICYPICPAAAYEGAFVVCMIGVVSMVYGAFAALAQKDFKRLVAYSSVSHMGYVVLGIGAASAQASTAFNPEYWMVAVNGAMFQMIGHGISSPGMFFMVGVIYDRVHHRNLDEFGGLFGKMPVYAGLAVPIFFAGLGLPGLCGFIGEVLVVLATWKYSAALAVVSAFVVILTAAYILWTLQRVYLGAEYRGPHPEAIADHPITAREVGIAAPLIFLAVLFGVFPKLVFDYLEPSTSQVVKDLTAWKQAVTVHAAAPAPPAAAADAGANVAGDALPGLPQAAAGKPPAPEARLPEARLPETVGTVAAAAAP